ncbi:MAG: tyrosine-type recombinase/integrase [Candidatus Aminicenantes bacterium]|nr:tyrosine-type recombinase/integrase [Candidatus Aminicenantes bacterium]
MGSVFLRRRKDARARKWYVEYSYGGKRIRKLAKGANTKSEAKAHLREIETQIDRGEYVPGKRKEVLFEVFTDYYLKWAKANKLSWDRDSIFVDHLNSFFKGMLLHRISPLLIEDYKMKRKSKVTGTTVNKELSCLRHMFNMAIDSGVVSENPVRKVRFFREDNRKERVLNFEEGEALIGHAKGYLKDVIVVALNTGMRRGEILNLRWEDVDFDRRFVFVEKTKSGRARSIPMNSVLFETLRRIRRNGTSEEYVFWNKKTGKPIQDVKKSFKSACEDAGIENLRFHDLRHTFATRLVESGVDIVTVAELLGHTSLRMTMRYSHPSPDHKRNAVEMLVREEGNPYGSLPGSLTGPRAGLPNTQKTKGL